VFAQHRLLRDTDARNLSVKIMNICSFYKGACGNEKTVAEMEILSVKNVMPFVVIFSTV